MIDARQVAAFTEYVLRPMSDDWRQIVEKLQQLNLPISEALIRECATRLVAVRLIQEVIRAVTYIVIVGVVCITAWATLSGCSR